MSKEINVKWKIYGKKIFIALLLISVCYFQCFWQLEKIPLRVWDEARLAVNAAEMFKKGLSLVTTFENVPDLWNTKPPLMIWLQYYCMKLLGMNLLAVRLPSAIAGCITCIALFYYSKKKLGLAVACCAVLVLLSSYGFISFHVVRTGDYDALLVLFSTLLCFIFFEILLNHQNTILWLGFTIVLLAGILTKGVAILMLLPGLLLWSILKSKLRNLLHVRWFWISVAMVLFGTAMYYVGRELLLPGYMKAVWYNELGGRFGTALEGHEGPFYFYWDIFFDFNRYYIWGVCALIGFFVSLKDASLGGKLITFLSLQTFVFLCIISIAQTKLEWYIAPIFPFTAIIAGYGIVRFLRLGLSKTVMNPILKRGILVCIIIGISAYPYAKNLSFVYDYKMPSWEEEYYAAAVLIHHHLKEGISLDSTKVMLKGYESGLDPHIIGKMNNNGGKIQYYYPDILFYTYMAKEKGWQMKRAGISDLKSGDKVILGNNELIDSIQHNFNCILIHEYGLTKIFRLSH